MEDKYIKFSKGASYDDIAAVVASMLAKRIYDLLTNDEAVEEFLDGLLKYQSMGGCTRLAARISEIEARHPIGRAWEVRRRNGHTKKFIRYYLIEEE